MRFTLRSLFLAAAAALALGTARAGVSLLNASYDPTREFYQAYNAAFARFPKLELLTIEDFGGWHKVQQEHFADGGLFDRIVAK